MRNLWQRFCSSGLVFLVVSMVLLVADRYTKLWALENLQYGEPLRIAPFLNFTLAFNTGAAFSMLHNASGWQHLLLGGLATVTVIFIAVWLARSPRSEALQNLALSMIAAGALGNVWDRIVYGHVVDFISFHLGGWYFAIFNVADSAICVGAGLLMLKWLVFGK